MISHRPFRLLLGEKVGIGTSEPKRGQVAVVAKRAKEEQPLNTANELASAKLAQLLGLPIPPFGVAYQDGIPFFHTADFNPDRSDREAFTPDGEKPNFADWSRITSHRTPLCWGIILFDIWVVNPDRAPINIACLPNSNQVVIFDHGGALHGGNPTRKLKNNADSIKCLGRRDDGEVKHPLARFIGEAKGFENWITKIRSIPPWQIRDALRSGKEFGYTDEMIQEAFDFLVERKKRLAALVGSEMDEWFPALSPEAKAVIASHVIAEAPVSP